jgi:hypothetical protein
MMANTSTADTGVDVKESFSNCIIIPLEGGGKSRRTPVNEVSRRFKLGHRETRAIKDISDTAVCRRFRVRSLPNLKSLLPWAIPCRNFAKVASLCKADRYHYLNMPRKGVTTHPIRCTGNFQNFYKGASANKRNQGYWGDCRVVKVGRYQRRTKLGCGLNGFSTNLRASTVVIIQQPVTIDRPLSGSLPYDKNTQRRQLGQYICKGLVRELEAGQL